MLQTLRNSNLFRYATSELSQDAFICWLISHATAESWDEDVELRNCAIAFLNRILNVKGTYFKDKTRVKAIKRQYKNIDILIEIEDYTIIIEDKTFTDTHDDQINRYKQTLIKEGIPDNNIICVYYKIEEQPHPEKDVHYEFTRDKLLEIFNPFREKTNNQIFVDYVDYLKWIDLEVNSFKTLPIVKWSYRSYIGFFKHLSNTILKGETLGWGYVANPTGGFMGLWWSGIVNSNDLNKIGINEQHANEIYLQIENDIISVKYTVDLKVADIEKVKKIRWALYKYFRSKLGESFTKKTFRSGNYMTVGYIRYSEADWEDKLLLMKNTMLEMISNNEASENFV